MYGPGLPNALKKMIFILVFFFFSHILTGLVVYGMSKRTNKLVSISVSLFRDVYPQPVFYFVSIRSVILYIFCIEERVQHMLTPQ